MMHSDGEEDMAAPASMGGQKYDPAENIQVEQLKKALDQAPAPSGAMSSPNKICGGMPMTAESMKICGAGSNKPYGDPQ